MLTQVPYQKSSSSSRVKPILETQIKAVAERFFGRGAGAYLKITPELEGSRYDATTNQLSLGCKAGPSLEISALLHEMAHLAEIDDQRVRRNNWGLKSEALLPTKISKQNPNATSKSRLEYLTANGFPRPFRTRQHIDREIRVIAYQASLEKYFFGKLVMEDDYLDYLNGLIYLPESLVTFGYSQSAFSHYCYVKLEEACSSGFYSLENFDREWRRKIKLISR